VNDEVKFQQLKQNFIAKTQEYIAMLENLMLEDLLNPKIYGKIASLQYQSILHAANLSELTTKIIIKSNSLKSKDRRTPSKNIYL